MTFLRFLTYFCSNFAQSGARDDGGFLLSRGTQQQKQPKDERLQKSSGVRQSVFYAVEIYSAATPSLCNIRCLWISYSSIRTCVPPSFVNRIWTPNVK